MSTPGSFMSRTTLLSVLHLIVFWPVVHWYWERTLVDSGNGYALAALATAVALIIYKSRGRSAGAVPMLPVGFTLLYGVLAVFAPWQLCASMAFFAIATMWGSVRQRQYSLLPVCGLFGLALPAIPWLQLYVGYPLRCLSAAAALPFLRAYGYNVTREGSCFVWGDTLVAVDAPCSGINMLWAMGFAACVLATCFGLPARRTLFVGIVALGITIVGNILRTASLFFLETHIIPLDRALHQGVGLMIFFLLAIIVYVVSKRLSRRGTAIVPSDYPPQASPTNRRPTAVLAAVSLFAAFAPLFRVETVAPIHAHPFDGWPTEWEGISLTPLPLDEIETRFAKTFPGKTARFAAGDKALLIRWIAAPSRKVHAAAHCLTAHGFRITPGPLYIDDKGAPWGRFTATKDDLTVEVREQYRDAVGRAWSDVSSWYWSALLGESSGPWWGYTVSIRMPTCPSPETDTTLEHKACFFGIAVPVK
jgi:exosortase/archaeosortase family protein